MGLDISFYSKAKLVLPADRYDEEQERDGRDYFYVLDEFRAQADGLVSGWYATEGEHGGFRAGSYGGYNRWRDSLSQLVLGVPAERVWHSPVLYDRCVELINFSDCEGVIGPVTSEKLAADMCAVREQFFSASEEYDQRTFDRFLNAFTVASRGGLVQFC